MIMARDEFEPWSGFSLKKRKKNPKDVLVNFSNVEMRTGNNRKYFLFRIIEELSQMGKLMSQIFVVWTIFNFIFFMFTLDLRRKIWFGVCRWICMPNVGQNFFIFSRLHFRENYIWKLDKLLVKFVNFQFDTSAQSTESYFILENVTKIFPFENFFLFQNSLITRKYI